MKKKLAMLLTAALTVTTAFTATATEEVAGEWYANFYGTAMTMTLEDDGAYILKEETEGEEDEGVWEFDGETLILDKGEESEMSFVYGGEVLSADLEGMEMVFSRDPEALKGFVPAEILTDAKLEDFAGDWTGTQVGAFDIVMPLDMMEIEELGLGIKDNLIAFRMAGGDFFGEWELSDIEGELKDGVLTFVIPAEDEYSEDSEWNIRLHEDGTMSLATTMMEDEIVFYMEAAAE